MRKIISYSTIACAAVLAMFGCNYFFNQQKKSSLQKLMPLPAESTIVIGEREEGDYQTKRKQWYEGRHKAAPDVDWRAIEKENMLLQNEATMNAKKYEPKSMFAETFANGALVGTWYERGSLNQAGRITACDYYKTGNKLYVLSDAGCLFRGFPDSANWKALNNNLTFRNNVLKVIPNAQNTPRILASIGENVYYSDNDGTLFTPSSGITFPVGWGGNYVAQIVSLNDATKTVYVLTHLWDNTPWAPRYWLYKSTDRGTTFTKIHSFAEGGDDNRLSLWIPYNSSTNFYALANQPLVGNASTVYQISGNTVTALNSSSTLPVNVNCKFKGYKGTTTTMYALTNSAQLYSSTNFGATWTLKSNLPEGGGTFAVSVKNANNVNYGGVNQFRATNGGATWTKINEWYDYYGDPLGKLHADIQSIEYFKKTNGTEFGLNMNDGGIYRTDDYNITNKNIGLTGLNISQYYDVKTEPNGTWVHCGSQDQGFQRTGSLGATAKTNLTQVISGDYGYLQLTGTNQDHLWTEYPGGEIYYYNDAHAGLSSTYSLPGSAKPLYGWILPTAKLYPAANNKILITGGNVNGGSGSYLVTLTAATTAPYTITGTQYNYDFRANSNNGTSGLSAVETTPLNAAKIYCSTEDGTFFYSNNTGTSWNKTSAFNGVQPHWLHGNAIYASRHTANLVYFAGSGYSNPPIYKSTDGGATFTAINNGLPDCAIFDLDANATETLLFAATSAGPYVYVVSTNTWYNIKGKAAYCEYYSVEYLSSKKVRFGTYGRGFWDFNITTQPVVNIAQRFENEILPTDIFVKQVVDGKIYFTENFKTAGRLQFFDVTGKLLFTKQINDDAFVDVSQLKPALYVYSFQSKAINVNGKILVR